MTYPEARMLRRNDVITVKHDRHQEIVESLEVRRSPNIVIINCKSGNMYKHTLIETSRSQPGKSGGGRRELTHELKYGQFWLARVQFRKTDPEKLSIIQLTDVTDTNKIKFRILDSHTPFEPIFANQIHLFELLQFIKD